MSGRIRAEVMAPVHHVPPRARVGRSSYVTVDVSVHLRDLGGADHREGPAIPCPGGKVLRTRVLDGRIWRPVRLDDGVGKDPAKQVSADEFRRWLGGDPATGRLDTRDAARCFAGTPLVARLPSHQGELRARGACDEASLGRILRDGRERAARLGAAYLDGSVALLSGVPHVRMRGPLAFHDDGVGQRRIVRHPGALTTYAKALHALPFRVRDGDAQRDFEARHPVAGAAAEACPDEWDAGLFDGLDLDADDDIDLFVATSLRLMLESRDRVPVAQLPHAPERLLRLDAYADLSSVGLVEAHETADLCALIAAAADEQAGTQGYWHATRGLRLAAFAREVALPRLAERSSLLQVESDTDALAALAP